MAKSRIAFDDVRPRGPATRDALSVASLRFTITPRQGAAGVFDFTALPGTPLVHKLVGGLQQWLLSRRFLRKKHLSVPHNVGLFSTILRALDDAGVTRLGELDADTHDAVVEETLWAAVPDSVARKGLQMLHEALRQLDVDELHPSMPARLQYQSNRPRVKSTPRDAYSARERTLIRKACLRDMSATLQRLDTEATRLLGTGGDPRTARDYSPAPVRSAPRYNSFHREANEASRAAIRSAIERLHGDAVATAVPTMTYLARAAGLSLNTVRKQPDLFESFTRMLAESGVSDPCRRTHWLSVPHLAWELNARGPMTVEDFKAQSGASSNRDKALSIALKAIFPAPEEFLPFQLYLQLQAGLPPDACYDLGADCLQPIRAGLANLRYYKGRARRNIVQSVETETLASVGGAVKTVLKITERLRAHVPDGVRGRLWLSVGAQPLGSIVVNAIPGSQALAAFVQRHGITHDDGTPLRLTPARLRKSYKANIAEATQGNLDDLASDHSREVSAKHYGNIPALRPMHEATIEDAANDALEAAMRVTIVPPEQEATLLATGPMEHPSGVRSSRMLAVIQQPSEHDVFLSGCMGFFDSPWAKRKGDPCPVATWRCLECDNAVITKRHLPRLLAFHDHLLRERDILDAEVWHLKYGQAYELLERAVLPRFPQRFLDEARALASVDTLAWLPPELRVSHLTQVPRPPRSLS